jgi:hypothetical protein
MALDMVHYLCGPEEGLFLVFAGIKKDILSLFTDEGKGL